MQSDSQFTEDSKSSDAEIVSGRGEPWGLWATIGLSLVALFVTVLVQAAVAVVALVVRSAIDPKMPVQRLAEQIAGSGLVISLATIISLPVGLGMIALWVKSRPGCTLGSYVAIEPVTMRQMFGWLGTLLVWLTCWDGVTYLFGGILVPPFMEQIYRTSGWPPLLWIALVVGAPLGEEILFRGFLLTGLQPRLGTAGAITVAAVTWGLLHLQYNAFGIAMIMATGLLFGAARVRSGSLYPPLAMHAMLNFIATLQAAWWQAK